MFQGPKVICVMFKLNESSYRLDLHSSSVQPLKLFVQRLYDNLADDVMINVCKQKKLAFTPSKNVDKKMALLSEISSLKHGSKACLEVETDSAFLLE